MRLDTRWAAHSARTHQRASVHSLQSTHSQVKQLSDVWELIVADNFSLASSRRAARRKCASTDRASELPSGRSTGKFASTELEPSFTFCSSYVTTSTFLPIGKSTATCWRSSTGRSDSRSIQWPANRCDKTNRKIPQAKQQMSSLWIAVTFKCILYAVYCILVYE